MPEAAVRIDPITEIEERLDHVPTPRGYLYTWTGRPARARSCVIVCSSLFGDFTANYHRERLLGKALTASGHGAVRFHYAGEGNSQGERRDMTFSSLCDDAGAALDHAVSLGFVNFAFLGTRLGGLVAAATVASMRFVPLALWEPVSDPLSFIAGAQRAKQISRAARGGGDRHSDWRQELEQNGFLDVVGYDVYAHLIESLDGVDLLSILGPEPRRVFIGRFRAKGGASDPLSEELSERGFSVDWGAFGLSESWWFHNELAPETGDLITATNAWLTNALAGV